MFIIIDNIAAIMMANAGKPTERSRHIDIQLFTFLSWVKAEDTLLSHIKRPTTHQMPLHNL
jgi:hypothetical protein